MSKKIQGEIERTLKKVQEGVTAFEDIVEKLRSLPSIVQLQQQQQQQQQQQSINPDSDFGGASHDSVDLAVQSVSSAALNNLKEKLELDLKKEIKRLQRYRDQIKVWLNANDIKFDKEVLSESRRLVEVQMETFRALEKELKVKAFSKEGLLLASSARKDADAIAEMPQINQSAYKWVTEVMGKLQEQVDDFERKLDDDAEEKDSELEAKYEKFIERHNWHIQKLSEIQDKLLFGKISGPKLLKAIKDDLEYYMEAYDVMKEDDYMQDDEIYDEFRNAEEHLLSDEKIQPPKKDEPKAEEVKKEEQIVANPNPPAAVASKVVAPQKKIVSTPAVPFVASSCQPQQTTATAAVKSSNPSLVVKPSASASSLSSAAAVLRSSVVVPQAPTTAPTIGGWATIAKAGLERRASLGNDSASNPIMFPATTNKSSTNSSNAPPPPPFTTATATSTSTSTPSAASETAPNAALLELVSVVSKNKPLSEYKKEELLSQLDLSMAHLPEFSHKDKTRNTLPRNTKPLPLSFPKSIPAEFSSPGFFEKLDTESLFYAFYYQQKSYQQFLAARELKRQSWRFHKKYLTWFQRHSEPKMLGEDSEGGTYIYFDYEGSWCQRKKAQFCFEYKYLEDSELII